jgi:hypothetical protein
MQLLGAIVDEASNARLPFVVIGGTAVNAFGHARLTLDLDLLVPRRDIQGWEALLAKFGFLRVNHEQPGSRNLFRRSKTCGPWT